jgi:hypothetical protein
MSLLSVLFNDAANEYENSASEADEFEELVE